MRCTWFCGRRDSERDKPVHVAMNNVPLIPRMLPLPSPWVAVLYFLPSIIGLLGVYLRWKRYKHVATQDMQDRARAGTYAMAAVFLISASVIASMIEW